MCPKYYALGCILEYVCGHVYIHVYCTIGRSQACQGSLAFPFVCWLWSPASSSACLGGLGHCWSPPRQPTSTGPCCTDSCRSGWRLPWDVAAVREAQPLQGAAPSPHRTCRWQRKLPPLPRRFGRLASASWPLPLRGVRLTVFCPTRRLFSLHSNTSCAFPRPATVLQLHRRHGRSPQRPPPLAAASQFRKLGVA